MDISLSPEQRAATVAEAIQGTIEAFEAQLDLCVRVDRINGPGELAMGNHIPNVTVWPKPIIDPEVCKHEWLWKYREVSTCRLCGCMAKEKLNLMGLQGRIE